MNYRKVNPAYYKKVQSWGKDPEKRILSELESLCPRVSKKEIRKMFRSLRVKEAGRIGIPYYAQESNFRRLKYVRFADDFLLGFVGPKKEALCILQKVVFFINVFLNLQVNVDKTKLLHHSRGVHFLGYNIVGNYSRVLMKKDSAQRTSITKLVFKVPTKKLINRYIDRGFLQYAKRGKKGRVVGCRQNK